MFALSQAGTVSAIYLTQLIKYTHTIQSITSYSLQSHTLISVMPEEDGDIVGKG